MARSPAPSPPPAASAAQTLARIEAVLDKLASVTGTAEALARIEAQLGRVEARLASLVPAELMTAHSNMLREHAAQVEWVSALGKRVRALFEEFSPPADDAMMPALKAQLSAALADANTPPGTAPAAAPGGLQMPPELMAMLSKLAS